MELTQHEIALAGMGDLKRKTIDPAIIELQNMLLAKEGSNRFRRQFIEQMHNLPKATIQGLMDGSMQLADKVYYSRVNCSSGTSFELVPDGSMKKGVRNTKDQEVEHPFVMSAISLEYSATSPDLFDHATMAPEISRGEISFGYDRKEIMFFPVNGTFVSLANYDTQKPYGMYMLNNPKVLLKGKKINVSLHVPEAFSAGTHSAGIKLHGTEVVTL